MEFADSLIFLMLIILFVSSIKSNFFLIVVGSAIFLFFILNLFSFSPLEILTLVFNHLIFNPIGFLILFFPLIFDTLVRFLKKKFLKEK